MSFKIALAGDLGSGKSTVSKILIEKTGATYYSTGTVCRALAKKHGMSIDEFNVYMETHPEVDKEIDDGLCALSKESGDYIVDSRMAFHFVEGSFSVYLATDPIVSATRILNDNRDVERFASVEEAASRIRIRRTSENKRYFEKYGVHITDLRNYDLVLDTTYLTPEEVAEAILHSLKARLSLPDFRLALLSPQRLSYKKDALRLEVVAGLCAELKFGMPLPLPRVCEKDARFYILSGADSAEAHLCDGKKLIPCRLTGGRPSPLSAFIPLSCKEC